jgi:hypothetical protein
MPLAVDRYYLETARRALLVGFLLALGGTLLIHPENLRGALASVCAADFVPEPREEDEREEDETESVLIAHAAPQRGRQKQRHFRGCVSATSASRRPALAIIPIAGRGDHRVPHRPLRC